MTAQHMAAMEVVRRVVAYREHLEACDKEPCVSERARINSLQSQFLRPMFEAAKAAMAFESAEQAQAAGRTEGAGQ